METLFKIGLDTKNYPGKWKRSKEYVKEVHPSLTGLKYWNKVRTGFLERGGCYKWQH